MWIGVLSEPALRRAAALGDGWVSKNMQLISQVAETAGRSRAFFIEQNFEPFVCAARDAWVTPFLEAVIRDWYGWVVENHLSYRRAGYPIADPEGIYSRLEKNEAVGLEKFTRDCAIAGTPNQCVAQLEEWRCHVDCQAMLLLLNEDAGFDKMLAMIELFGREVFPRLDVAP